MEGKLEPVRISIFRLQLYNHNDWPQRLTFYTITVRMEHFSILGSALILHDVPRGLERH